MATIPSNPCLVVVIRVGCISEPEKLMSFCNNNHWLKVISSGGMLFVHYSNAKFALIFLDRDILYAPLRYPLHASLLHRPIPTAFGLTRASSGSQGPRNFVVPLRPTVGRVCRHLFFRNSAHRQGPPPTVMGRGNRRFSKSTHNIAASPLVVVFGT